LDQDSLQPLKCTVDAQEIVNIILRAPGVKRVKQLKASSPPDPPSDAPIKIKEGYVPRLDPPILKPQDSYTICIELEGNVKWHVDSKAVWAKIQELEADMRNNMAYAARSFQAMKYLRVPRGEYKDVESYSSIQHQFPVVYGLSKYGVDDKLVDGLVLGSRKERHAQVHQLKAYLLFFEQLLANYLSQLAHVGDLFSLDEELRKSYFYQSLAHHPPRPTEPQKIADVLVQQAGGTLRSLSHYLVCVVEPSGKIVFVSHRLSKLTQAQELRSKILESGQNRHNYQVKKSNGSEFHLALHTGAGDFLALGQERFSTAEAARHAAERWASFMTGLIKVKQLMERLVKIYRREDLSLQVIDESSRIVLTSTGIQSQDDLEKRASEIITCGTDPRNYRFAAVPRGGFRVHLHNQRGELIAEGEETFETEFDAEESVDRLVGLILRIAQNPSLREKYIRQLPEVEEIGRDPLRAYLDNLAVLERQNDNNYLRRRNRILDHLLARFGEYFDNEILQQLDLRPFGEKDDFYHELIRWKIEFLRGYIDAPRKKDDALNGGKSDAAAPGHDRHGQELGLGSGRGQAFDYGATDGSNVVSGLERRLTLLLGLHGHMDGKQYHRMDANKEGAEDSGFYYVEKQVSSLKSEQVEDNKGEKYDVPRHRILGSWRAGEPDLYDLHHNFVFSSEDSGILRHLLSFGTNRENYRLRIVRDEYQVLFRSPNSDHGVEVHRAIGPKEAEHAITALIRHLQWLKESVARSYVGERVWVVEHVLLRPRGEAHHGPVRISHKAGIHLSSPSLHSEHKDERLKLILHHGQHQENYKIELDNLGDPIVVLYHGQKPIAYSHPLGTEQEAKAAVLLLAELVRSLSHSKDNSMRGEHVHQQAHDAFYSHRMSVFLPNWPLRFQSNEFKLYAEQIIQENSPAHLAVNCFWLSAYDAKIFERMYNDWKSLNLEVHGGNEPAELRPVKALDEASEKIKDFIQRLQREQERWTASSTDKQ
jgi:uncharacterized protein YegP (UPF0339 family)